MKEFKDVQCLGTEQSFGVFGSIGELHNYITTKEINEAFAKINASLESRISGYRGTKFTMTESFEEACDLLFGGWKKGAEELSAKTEEFFKGSVVSAQSAQNKRKTIYDVAGYQVSVPRYLQGVPTSMVRTMNVPVKDKIVTINKVMGYRGDVRAETILNESAKALAIVKRLEDMGYRVNLNVVNLSRDYGNNMLGLKVKIKSASERLNISKLAFPMCHPSMMRRVIFAFKEIFPHTKTSFCIGYGASEMEIKYFAEMCKGEYVLPPFIDESVVTAKELNIEQFKV